MKWQNLPRWARDTISVVGAMAVLLVIYDGFFAKNVNWVLVPIQIVVALLAVGVWSFFSYRSQQKRKLAEEQKQAAAKKRAIDREQKKAAGAKMAAATREKNLARNQSGQQQQRHHE